MIETILFIAGGIVAIIVIGWLAIFAIAQGVAEGLAQHERRMQFEHAQRWKRLEQMLDNVVFELRDR